MNFNDALFLLYQICISMYSTRKKNCITFGYYYNICKKYFYVYVYPGNVSGNIWTCFPFVFNICPRQCHLRTFSEILFLGHCLGHSLGHSLRHCHRHWLGYCVWHCAGHLVGHCVGHSVRHLPGHCLGHCFEQYLGHCLGQYLGHCLGHFLGHFLGYTTHDFQANFLINIAQDMKSLGE